MISHSLLDRKFRMLNHKRLNSLPVRSGVKLSKPVSEPLHDLDVSQARGGSVWRGVEKEGGFLELAPLPVLSSRSLFRDGSSTRTPSGGGGNAVLLKLSGWLFISSTGLLVLLKLNPSRFNTHGATLSLSSPKVIKMAFCRR